jgi:hypothetical protein
MENYEGKTTEEVLQKIETFWKWAGKQNTLHWVTPRPTTEEERALYNILVAQGYLTHKWQRDYAIGHSLVSKIMTEQENLKELKEELVLVTKQFEGRIQELEDSLKDLKSKL